MLNIYKKIIVILLLAIIFISNAYNLVKATYEITKADIVQIGEADYHLKYYKEEKGMYTYATCSIVGYYDKGNFYPAYCLNRDMHGVGAVDSYTVDVDELINDDKVWRAVKNGYPYKSAEEMGLNSDFDAFAVTKFAIYCLIGQADINLYTADDEDLEGQAMLKALHELVEIGLNGTEKFSDELKITKEGDMIEEGEYYSIIYKVEAGSTVKKYNITSISGLSDGDLLTDLDGNIKTDFNSNENFKIKIAKKNLNSDKNINIEIKANLKNYPLYYGKTRIAGTQNYLLTASSYQDLTSNINTNLKLNTGKIIVNKIDSETKQGIENTTFELYNEENRLIATLTTDDNGKIEFTDLYQGNYKLKEIKANENYILNENQEFDIKVDYNKTSTINIENKHKKGNLEILKVDKQNNAIALGNIEFELYNEQTKEKIGTYYTDENGKIFIENLRIGNYLLKETKTNKWYNLANDSKVEIKWNETSKITVEDELKKGQIKVIKVDKDNNEIKIPGVKFEVLDNLGNVLETIVTDENGEALTKNYTLRDNGTIRLHEFETNEKYELNEEIQEIVLEENQIKNVIFENEKIKGKIKIIKTSETKSNLAGLEENAPIEGVKFEIYNEENELMDTIITDNNGIAISKELEKGVYKIKETETNKWYLLDEKEHFIEIEKNKQIVELSLKNTPATPDEEVEKNGTKTAQPSGEIEYKINVKNTGNVPLDNFVLEDEIPTEYIKVNKIKLGTYNQDNTYNLYYKTNLTQNYVLLFEEISTLKEEEIDLSKELADGEYITNIKLDFGTVDAGFSTKTESLIYSKVNSNLKNGTKFENTAKLTSNYKGFNLSKESKSETEIYKILPQTGM